MAVTCHAAASRRSGARRCRGLRRARATSRGRRHQSASRYLSCMWRATALWIPFQRLRGARPRPRVDTCARRWASSRSKLCDDWLTPLVAQAAVVEGRPDAAAGFAVVATIVEPRQVRERARRCRRDATSGKRASSAPAISSARIPGVSMRKAPPCAASGLALAVGRSMATTRVILTDGNRGEPGAVSPRKRIRERRNLPTPDGPRTTAVWPGHGVQGEDPAR